MSDPDMQERLKKYPVAAGVQKSDHEMRLDNLK